MYSYRSVISKNSARSVKVKEAPKKNTWLWTPAIAQRQNQHVWCLTLWNYVFVDFGIVEVSINNSQDGESPPHFPTIHLKRCQQFRFANSLWSRSFRNTISDGTSWCLVTCTNTLYSIVIKENIFTHSCEGKEVRVSECSLWCHS